MEGQSPLSSALLSLPDFLLLGSRKLSPCLGLELLTHHPFLTVTAVSLAISLNQTSIH